MASQEQSQDLTPVSPNSESSIFYIHELVNVFILLLSSIGSHKSIIVIILYGESITGCLVDSREGNVPSLVGGNGVNNIWCLCVKHNMPQIFKSTLKNKEFLH